MMRKPGYYVDARTSRTFQRVFDAPPVDMTMGPYKRLKFAKKKATAMRKARCVADCMDGRGYVDYGLTYKDVLVWAYFNDRQYLDPKKPIGQAAPVAQVHPAANVTTCSHAALAHDHAEGKQEEVLP